VKLRFDATYLVVGGLGGIGRSVSRILAERGAKHLLLISRSAGKPSDQEFLSDLKNMGCNVHTQQCDVASRESLMAVENMLKSHSMPPVRGIVQAAMVLEDAVFERMSHAKWRTAVMPKVEGTINLHDQFLGEQLDFFIMLSSLIGISGHSSQANYAAGSTFQDAFARWRTAQGLPAVAIDLGFVKAVGYVAENQGVAERMAQMGYRQLKEQEVLRIIESAIRVPKRTIEESQIITGIGTFDETQNDVPWRQEPRFSSLRAFATDGSADTGDHQKSKTDRNASQALIDSLTKAPSWTEGTKVIATAIITKLSDMFMIPEAEIDQTKSPSAYGVDSLVAVELRNWLFARVQAELSIFEVLQSVSLSALAELTAVRSKLIKEAGLIQVI
jgi:NAD(P)-dependent dehydrogenase (short-subunit alcohol dehydrogenase family)